MLCNRFASTPGAGPIAFAAQGADCADGTRAKRILRLQMMSRVIFHVDMDAFFASVEQRDHPAYRGKPVIVGAPPDQRGVVCAASYEARQFKVRSAMPSRTAAKLCPHGIFVRPRMEAYRAESAIIMEMLREVSLVLEKISVDEAYLDVSASFQTPTTQTPRSQPRCLWPCGLFHSRLVRDCANPGKPGNSVA